jgi:hypothetical protein
MTRTWTHPLVPNQLACIRPEEETSLRTVVCEYADCCFLDTDGVTRDAARMLQIMDAWRPKCSDREAGVRRNVAFDPNLHVVVDADRRICYPDGVEHRGQPALLFTIVPRGVG